jgi:hypothetical protein
MTDQELKFLAERRKSVLADEEMSAKCLQLTCLKRVKSQGLSLQLMVRLLRKS